MEKLESEPLGSHGAPVPVLPRSFLCAPPTRPPTGLGEMWEGRKREDARPPTPPPARRPRPHPGGPRRQPRTSLPRRAGGARRSRPRRPGPAPSAPVSSPSSQTPPPVPAAAVRFPASRSRGPGAASAPGLRLPARPAPFAGHGAPSSGSRAAGAPQPVRLVSAWPGEGAVESGRGVEISRPRPHRSSLL